MPLSNKTILVTRTRKQSVALIEMLEKHGCLVLNVPTIEISEADNPEHLQKRLKDISAFHWIIFTSANAVRFFFSLKNPADDDLPQVKIACVGKKTSEVLNSFGFEAHLIPVIFSNKGLLDELNQYNIRGKHILLPVSNVANTELETGLRSLGAHVKRMEIYKNVPYKDPEWDSLYRKITDKLIDCLIFYSPSALKAFVQLIGEEGIELINRVKIPIAVIGSSTAQAAREHALHPEIIPSESDDEHLVEALKNHFGVME